MRDHRTEAVILVPAHEEDDDDEFDFEKLWRVAGGGSRVSQERQAREANVMWNPIPLSIQNFRYRTTKWKPTTSQAPLVRTP